MPFNLEWLACRSASTMAPPTTSSASSRPPPRRCSRRPPSPALSGPVGAAAAVAALEPRGAHAVIPTRRIAFGRWIGQAATGFTIADGVQSGLDATRGRPLNDRVEAATVGAGVASAFGAAGAAAATSTAAYPFVAATVIVLALAGGELAGRAVDQYAALGRRQSPAGDDLDALREEIADDDPGDVLVAATELAAAEEASLG